jgi:hypothetical protein
MKINVIAFHSPHKAMPYHQQFLKMSACWLKESLKSTALTHTPQIAGRHRNDIFIPGFMLEFLTINVNKLFRTNINYIILFTVTKIVYNFREFFEKALSYQLINL